MDTEWGGVGPGWDKLVQPLIARCKEEGTEILQIKEKFGGLSFYVNNPTEDTYQAIRAAENASYKTCDQCGEVGSCWSRGGWLLTRCEKCRD